MNEPLSADLDAGEIAAFAVSAYLAVIDMVHICHLPDGQKIFQRILFFHDRNNTKSFAN